MVHIGILTYFRSINYGAFLQAYAFQKYLEEKYKAVAEVEIINFDTKVAQMTYINRVTSCQKTLRGKMIKQYNAFVESQKKQKLSREWIVTDSIDKIEEFLKDKYDIIIVGSDEIWKTNSFRGFPNAYWLNFDLGRTVYMAYAVSGRNDYQKMNEKMQTYIKSSMQRYVYIGTRDEVTRKELLQIEKRNIERNCDPVFLQEKLFKISDKEKKIIRKKYGLSCDKSLISIMIKNEEVGTILYRMLKNENQVVYLYNINSDIKNYNLVELSPFEWNTVIGMSNLVITDFFHGTAFSILHNVPFISLEYSEKGRGKIENLLLENHLNNNFLYEKDYNGDNRRLALDLYTKGRREMRKHSSQLLKKVREKEREKSNSFFEKLGNEIERVKKNLLS